MSLESILHVRARRALSRPVIGAAVCVALAAAGMAATAGPAAASGVTISTRSTSLGLILVNGRGRTVYLFTRDTFKHSNCGSTCAKTWSRVLTSSAPHAGTGATQSKLGETSAHQVTYNGHPLYYYVGDKAAGQTNGQGRSSFKGRWWVLSPQGTAGTGTTIHLTQTSLGNVIAGPHGRTVYLLTADSRNHSTCYSTCARNWPPLITTGKPHVGSGLNSSLLGTALRTNGTRQVTYNGHPLYYFSGDTAAGQTNGEGLFAFGGYWYAVNAAGSQS
jgi:predicted lipoprotein with Yx(FWY)xxD motif